MKIALVANTDWYLFGYRKPLAAELMKQGHTVVLLSPRGEYAERLIAEGYTWQELAFSRKGTNPFQGLLDIFGFWSAYRSERFDVVHHFTIKAVIYGSVVAKLLSVPIIVNSITGLGSVFTSTKPSLQLIKKLVIVLYRIALRNTKVIFQNSSDMKYMTETGLVERRNAFMVRGSGVDTDSFTYEPEPSGLPVVLLVSRMLWEKGIQEFVDAARLLNKPEILAKFVLVGAPDSGNPSSIPEDQLRAWSESGDVAWVGWSDDMPTTIRESAIVCFPTYYGEGLPKVLLEAGAAGRPVVTTDIAACREIIQHEVNGLLVPPRDIPALTEALRRLILDAGLRLRLGKAAREIVTAEFTVEKINKQTIELYKEH